MSIKVTGVPSSVDAAQWSQLLYDLTRAGTHEAVMTGLICSPGAGALSTLVTAGRSIQAGTRAYMDADATVTHDPNASANPRLDLVCMRVNWSGTVDTAGSLVVIKGTPAATPQLPTLTRTQGSVWHTPLYSVLIDAGKTSGVLAAGKHADRRPRISERTCSGEVTLTDTQGASAPRVDVAFKPGFFASPPRVVVSEATGAGRDTTVNVWVVPGSITVDGFSIGMQRNTTTPTVIDWIASGSPA